MGAGLSEELVRASLPDWWDQHDPQSPSSNAMVSLLLARRLSIDPETLLDDGVPVGFLHAGPTKFKHMRLAPGDRCDALVAFAQGVTRIVLSMMPAGGARALPSDAATLRAAILESGSSFVGFGDVLTLCWSLGVPVLHLRLFPARTKGVTAMAVRLRDRHAILVARETGLPAQYMFHIAHELGHIALGHLSNASTIVDADPNDSENAPEELIDDEEERQADAFAQLLLTGSPSFTVVSDQLGTNGSRSGTVSELARLSVQVGRAYGIDPGHVVLCFGYSTGAWPMAMAAARKVQDQEEAPGTLVNRVLWQQLGDAAMPHDSAGAAYLQAVAAI